MKKIDNQISEYFCSSEIRKLLESNGCTLGEHRDGLITHALAIEWLRVNFEIWISIMYLDSVGNYGFIVTTITDNTEVKEEYYHLSPEEATEAALKYVLEELI